MSELAKAYFRRYHRDESCEWARDAVQQIMEYSVDSAWGIAMELINTAPSFECLSYVAAGELETLCRASGEAVIDKLRTEVLTNDRLLLAMTGVQLGKDEIIHEEFYRIAKEQLKYRDPKSSIDIPEYIKALPTEPAWEETND